MKIELNLEAAHAVVTIGITISVLAGLYFTRSAWCLLGFILIPGLNNKKD